MADTPTATFPSDAATAALAACQAPVDEAARAAASLALLRALVPAPVAEAAAGEEVVPSAHGSPALAAWAAALDALPAWRRQRFAAPEWSAREAAAWAACRGHCLAALGEQALAPARLQAQGALGWGWAAEPAPSPLLADAATLLFDGPRWQDEGLLVDVAVRWWQAARRSGSRLDEDFGEVWRQLEWTAAAQLLCAIATAVGEPVAAREATRVQQLQALALRYSGLKPLLRLFEPLFGSGPASGYTF